MVTIITEVSKYLMMILFACYTYECFSVLQKSSSPGRQKHILRRQQMFMFLIHLDAYLVIFAVKQEMQVLAFFVVQELLSAYHGEILPGIYDLSTSMTAEEMLAVMSTPAEESKEEDDDVGESVEESEEIENTEGMTAE